MPLNRSNGRLYNETDIDTLKIRNQSDRYKVLKKIEKKSIELSR